MAAMWQWVISHPEIVVWGVLSIVGAVLPEQSRAGQLARRWASDIKGPASVTAKSTSEVTK